MSPPRSGGRYRRPQAGGRGLVVDPALGADPGVEGVFHLAHLGDRVGDRHDRLRGVTTGEDQVDLLGSPTDDRPHLIQPDPTPLDRIGYIVWHTELVIPRL